MTSLFKSFITRTCAYSTYIMESYYIAKTVLSSRGTSVRGGGCGQKTISVLWSIFLGQAARNKIENIRYEENENNKGG